MHDCGEAVKEAGVPRESAGMRRLFSRDFARDTVVMCLCRVLEPKMLAAGFGSSRISGRTQPHRHAIEHPSRFPS